MEHKEYIKTVSGAETAVLFIHGIVGTPNHFSEFIPLLPENISVYNMLLDGHGKEVRDFSHTSMKKWEAQVEEAVSRLSRDHKEIYIAAHSMGTLFAIEQAVKNKKVTKLYLLATPIKIFWKPVMATYILKVYFDRIAEDDHIARASKNAFGIQIDKNIFHYIGWIPRYLELFGKIRRTRKILSQLDTPCTAYQSQKDELVAKSSASYLRKKSKMTVKTLENSGHYYYSPKDAEFLKKEFSKLFG